MNINDLFRRGARVGLHKITLGIDEAQRPIVLAEQFIKDPNGFVSRTQYQISAATHEAACLTVLDRAGLAALRVPGHNGETETPDPARQ